MKNRAKYYGLVLADERKRQGYSQEALGLEIGLGQSEVSDAENGKHLKRDYDPLCNALGITFLTLMLRADALAKEEAGHEKGTQ